MITTGPYAIVRNPMYSSATLYFIGTAFALGSYWTLIPAVLTTLCLVWRFSTKKNSSLRISLATRSTAVKYDGILCQAFFKT